MFFLVTLLFQNCGESGLRVLSNSEEGLSVFSSSAPYSWAQGGFSSCSASCGGGTQTQSVVCQDESGSVVANSLCTELQPAVFRMCNPQSCSSGGSSPEPVANFSPQNRFIAPFNAERVLTIIASSKAPGQNGQWWCDKHFGANYGGEWRCLEVSGGGSCENDVEGFSAVTCVNRVAAQSVSAPSGPTSGQTGQWWCDNHFGKNLGGSWLCKDVVGGGACNSEVDAGASIRCQSLMNPSNVSVSSPSPGRNGQWWCDHQFGNNKAVGQYQCVTQSNPQGDCLADSNAGSLVTCEQIRTGSGFGINMKPDTTCQRADLDPIEKEFCVNTDYTKYRTQDSWYLSSRYTRVGVNRAYGGTIYELYGTDYVNRILEHGGGAVQLSLWGYDAAASGAAAFFTTQTCDPTPYPTQAACMPHNAGQSCGYSLAEGRQISNCSTEKSCGTWMAASPINPIQAQADSCGWDRGSAAVTNIAGGGTNTLIIGKQNPYNFTKSTSVKGLYWDQRVNVPENAPFAKLQYNVNYTGFSLGMHNQEIPAIFADTQISKYYYLYEGAAPYANSQSAVTRLASTQMNAVYLPGRNGDKPSPTPTAPRQATEEWMSVCDATETQCVTVATFAPQVHTIVAEDHYITALSRFALKSGFADTWTVYIFPYRFDDVIEGKTVRQWIYELR